MAEDTNQFYASLPVNQISLSEFLIKDELFYDIPVDWYVIMTDIKKSTHAVSNGLHENVNLIATGSIVSLLNIAFKSNVSVPFFFGGDGATFIVPPILVNLVMPALFLHKENTLANFNLDLRIGIVAVRKVYEMGHQLKISKFSFSKLFPIPVVLGNGLNHAEQIIKAEDYLPGENITPLNELDLTGMQCRWDRVPPPENKEEVVTLLVVAREGMVQNQVFSEVMNALDLIYGTPEKRQPISVSKLKLKTTISRLKTEMRVNIGKIKYLDLSQTWFKMLFGPLYFRTREGRNYLRRMVEMSDTLVIDGKINTVISGTAKQRSDLQAALDKMENSGKIYYGLYVSNYSIMSCYVRDLKDDHIHFVDGSEGGYTHAAVILKGKLRNVNR